MNEHIRNTVVKIDEHIRRELWFDFHVINFDGQKLTIAGGIDLHYYHSLELIFEDVFFVSCFFQGWHSNTGLPVFVLPELSQQIELNLKFEIEQGYQLFVFKTKDYKNDCYVAAANISFNTDTVFYHYRPDLKENEHIADFVKIP